MAANDSHYNDGASNSDQNAAERIIQFPPTTPPIGGPPSFPLPPTPPGGNNSNPNWNWNNNNNNSSTFPSFPNQSYGQVRFLNASTNTFDVDITVDGNPFVLNSRFGNVSNYEWIADGFHTITVRRSSSIRTVLFQQNLPFSANQKVTMVLVDSAMGGLDMVRVVDTGCSNLPQTAACYRFANMSYPGSNFDLMLSNGETVFRNIGYQNVSPYKQAMGNTYQFAVTNANFQVTMRELPIIIIGASGTGTGTRETLLNYTATIEAGRDYTTYIIGNTWSDYSLRAITLED